MIPGTPVLVDQCLYESISPWMKRRHKHTGQLGVVTQVVGRERWDVAVLGGTCRAIAITALESSPP